MIIYRSTRNTFCNNLITELIKSVTISVQTNILKNQWEIQTEICVFHIIQPHIFPFLFLFFINLLLFLCKTCWSNGFVCVIYKQKSCLARFQNQDKWLVSFCRSYDYSFLYFVYHTLTSHRSRQGSYNPSVLKRTIPLREWKSWKVVWDIIHRLDKLAI